MILRFLFGPSIFCLAPLLFVLILNFLFVSLFLVWPLRFLFEFSTFCLANPLFVWIFHFFCLAPQLFVWLPHFLFGSLISCLYPSFFVFVFVFCLVPPSLCASPLWKKRSYMSSKLTVKRHSLIFFTLYHKNENVYDFSLKHL